MDNTAAMLGALYALHGKPPDDVVSAEALAEARARLQASKLERRLIAEAAKIHPEARVLKEELEARDAEALRQLEAAIASWRSPLPEAWPPDTIAPGAADRAKPIRQAQDVHDEDEPARGAQADQPGNELQPVPPATVEDACP